MLKRLLENKDGAAALVFTLSAPVILGGMVMLVEIGHWKQAQAKLQNVADMSAIAAARELMITDKTSDAEAAAIGDAAANGFDFSTGKVLANATITTGPYAGKRGVHVKLEQKTDLFFSKYFLGKNSNNLSYSAEATALLTGAGDPMCVLTLNDDPSVLTKGIDVGGSATVNVPDCGVFSNNPGTYSIEVGGRAYLNAGCINAAGGFNGDPSDFRLTDCASTEAYAEPVADPYDHLVLPPEASEPCKTPKTDTKSLVELEPGRYCNTLSITGDLVLTQPGTYVIDGSAGGQLTFKTSSSTMTGEGVTVVFINDAHVSFSGANLDLSAPTSGTYKGVLFHADSNTNTANKWISVEANATSKLEGVLYFPVWNLKYAGGSAIESECTSVIAHGVIFTGNSEMTAAGCAKYGAGKIGGNDGVAIFQ